MLTVCVNHSTLNNLIPVFMFVLFYNSVAVLPLSSWTLAALWYLVLTLNRLSFFALRLESNETGCCLDASVSAFDCWRSSRVARLSSWGVTFSSVECPCVSSDRRFCWDAKRDCNDTVTFFLAFSRGNAWSFLAATPELATMSLCWRFHNPSHLQFAWPEFFELDYVSSAESHFRGAEFPIL